MAYIGREPQIGNYQVCDAISVVNAQAAYTMQVNSVNVLPESVNHMIVSLNGVIQNPGSSYTISGATITFSSNLATGDSIDFIYLLGNVLDLGTPSDDTVTGAKIVDNAINSEHYTDASIDLAHMSANSIDSNQYVDGSIDTAHIADLNVTTGKIAADAITAAKIADNAISEEHLDVTAVTGHTAETSIADGDLVLIHDASASALRKMTKANFVSGLGGITAAHQWRLTTDFTGDANPIASNLEQVDSDGYGGIGSVMTQSSGIFTFPSTGIWLISFHALFLSGGSGEEYNFTELLTTADNSDFNSGINSCSHTGGSDQYSSTFSQFMLDVSNTTNVKVKFKVNVQNSSVTTLGNTGVTQTGFTFLRLGDT